MRTRTLARAAALVVVLISPPPARAGFDDAASNEPEVRLALPRLIEATRLSAPRTAALPDTVWVGHRHGHPGNYWEVGTASSRDADGGSWTFDDPVHGDSLQGWWPILNIYTGTGGLTLPDDQRAWWALDFGNQANYAISQSPAHARTFGVIGVWHRDVGNTGAGSGTGVGWAPLSGNASAWCGLRRHGDASHLDPVTGNAFNADVMQMNGVNGGSIGGGVGTNRKYPGYGSQWDQMLYRDLDLSGSPATDLTISFRIRTRMSTGMGTANNTRTGWFDRDPLKVAPGNFISSSQAGASAPIDSFMVYLGAPVDSSFVASDGLTHAVFDPLRRWLSEVLQTGYPMVPHRELFTTWGDRDTTVSVTVPAAFFQNHLVFSNGRLRLAFRVKTNRGFDDDGGSTAGAYSSGGAGAAILDDVVVNGVTVGDFEGDHDIDDDPNVPATAAWKSTGKPPGVFFHVHDLSTLVFDDLCGPIGGTLSSCRMSGAVVSAGDHDHGERAGGEYATAFQERSDGLLSPAICLATSGNTPNGWQLSGSQLGADRDLDIAYDLYSGIFDLVVYSNAWRIGAQSYPGRQSDGLPCWGDLRFPGFIEIDPDRQCFPNLESLTGNGLIVTSNPSGIPDSLRIFVGKIQECFRFGFGGEGCSPTDGAYWDNIALAIVPRVAAGSISVPLASWLQDTFPFNENNALPGTAAFDTCAALIQTGLNIAQSTNNGLRYDVPGDTLVAQATGEGVRLDLVFRIDPGPGNYVTPGVRESGLRRVPTSPTAVTSLGAGDSSFWAQYLADNGPFGTAGGHGASWNKHVWNSARCDTAESNLWPVSSRGIGGPVAGTFASMYHESDPKFATLGLRKHRCFVVDPAGVNGSSNITCSSVPAWTAAAGYAPELSGNPGLTLEYTKILPDGLLTPGAHIEYFLRRSQEGDPNTFAMVPDTSTVYPQVAEGSLDGHRWEEFSVLPNAWLNYSYGGIHLDCMLVIDAADRRGNELAWGSIADTIGLTEVFHFVYFGAHKGWHARGDASVNDPSGFVSAHIGQAGMLWDFYNVKGAEFGTQAAGSIGSRLSNRSSSLVDGKWSRQGPTDAMLKAYYSSILLMSGDLRNQILGPFADRSSNDTETLRRFLASATYQAPKSLFGIGSGLAESMTLDAAQHSLLQGYFMADLDDGSYANLVSAGSATNELRMATWDYQVGPGRFALRNHCGNTSDVLRTVNFGQVAAWYSPPGSPNQISVAAVRFSGYPPPGKYWTSLLEGFDLSDLASPFGDTSRGRLAQMMVALDLWGAPLGCGATDIHLGSTGVPPPPAAIDFARIAGNPMEHGRAVLDFGLMAPDRVEARIYDLGGRLVRTLADRPFPAGVHQLVWDGTSDDGASLPHGVYFSRLRYVGRGFTSAKKLVLLR